MIMYINNTPKLSDNQGFEPFKHCKKENSRYSKKLPTDKHPNIFIIAQRKINFNRFSKNKIINIFNKSVDIVEN